MNKSSLDLWVGVLVVAGVVALMFIALRAGDTSAMLNNKKASYELKARFDNIGSLKKEAPVRSSGVVIGRVTSVNFDPKKYEAVVTMSINNDYKFPDDTYAKIRTSGLLGEQFISMSVGGSERNFEPGETMTKTESALALEDLLGQFLYGGNSKSSSASTSKP